MCAFIQYTHLDVYYVPGAILGAGVTAMNKAKCLPPVIAIYHALITRVF